MNLLAKNVVLTGATGGIGSAIAKQLDAEGARLLLVGRNTASLATLKSTFGINKNHLYVEADIATIVGREKLAEIAQNKFDSVDLLINAAGINNFSFLGRQNEESIENQITTNLLAPILLARKFIPLMLKSKASRIVNIGSSFGSIGFPGYSAYCASKFGLRGFSEALRRELADTTIRVSYIAPRATQTSMNSQHANSMNAELGSRSDSPEYVATCVLKTIKKDRNTTFVGWPENLFVRLNALLPNLIDSNIRKNLAVIRAHAQS